MSLRSDLEAIVRGMPELSSVVIPVDWLRGRLEEAEREGDQPDSLLTLEEVGQRVGRATSTVRSWANSGKIPGAFRLNGRDWRVPESALQDYLEGQRKAEEGPKGIRAHREVDLSSWRQFRKQG